MSLSTADGGESVQSRRRRAWAPEVGDKVAAAARLVMARPWLSAGRDDESIAAVRRNETVLREVFGRPGWVLVVEPRDFVRLRKSPPTRLASYAADAPAPLVCSWFFLLVAAAEGLAPKVLEIAQLVTAGRAVRRRRQGSRSRMTSRSGTRFWRRCVSWTSAV